MPENSSNLKADAARWLDEYGDALYRYALRRVGSKELAEDLVQDTFIGALRSADQFEGRAKVQTWLTGILKNKITDHLRKLGRERKYLEQDRAEQELAVFSQGKWFVGVRHWQTESSLPAESQEFWTMLDQCADQLPEKLHTAFRMRDIEELSMHDVCAALSISAGNLSVRLHRARILLRECVDRNWFNGGES